MPEHLLHAAQVGASLEEVGGERVAEKVRMDPLRVEPGLRREPPDDEKCAGAGERPALGVEEELGPMAPVEVGPAPAR